MLCAIGGSVEKWGRHPVPAQPAESPRIEPRRAREIEPARGWGRVQQRPSASNETRFGRIFPAEFSQRAAKPYLRLEKKQVRAKNTIRQMVVNRPKTPGIGIRE
jgi:hypothetical protein